MNNTGGVIGLKVLDGTKEEMMGAYDELPPEYRRLLSRCPVNANLMRITASVDVYEEVLYDSVMMGTKETYGPDHPQYVDYLNGKTWNVV